jgi:hypothetical protein
MTTATVKRELQDCIPAAIVGPVMNYLVTGGGCDNAHHAKARIRMFYDAKLLDGVGTFVDFILLNERYQSRLTLHKADGISEQDARLNALMDTKNYKDAGKTTLQNLLREDAQKTPDVAAGGGAAPAMQVTIRPTIQNANVRWHGRPFFLEVTLNCSDQSTDHVLAGMSSIMRILDLPSLELIAPPMPAEKEPNRIETSDKQIGVTNADTDPGKTVASVVWLEKMQSERGNPGLKLLSSSKVLLAYCWSLHRQGDLQKLLEGRFDLSSMAVGEVRQIPGQPVGVILEQKGEFMEVVKFEGVTG